MLSKLKHLFSPKQLLSGNFGVEREMLRVNEEGNLSVKPHPSVFGDKVNNPYITTDFSESQIEVITPTFQSIEEIHHFLIALYDIVANNIGEEYLWGQSMPCRLPTDEDIPIAVFSDCEEGIEARRYREQLFEKYGGKKQLISGIHYNFSFSDDMLLRLYEEYYSELPFKVFKDEIYLKIARNYLRYRWLIIYLLGSTSAVHESFKKECVDCLNKISPHAYSNEGALSYRNSECGYGNETELLPNYTSVPSYVGSVQAFIEEKAIQSHKELYSQIRLKSKDEQNALESLLQDGVKYVEMRSIDINPFEKSGISLDDLYFVHLFTLYLLTKEESTFTSWQVDADENQKRIARSGQIEDLFLLKDGVEVSKQEWAMTILEEIKHMNMVLCLGKEAVIDTMINRVLDVEKTYSHAVLQLVKEQGYLQGHLQLANQYKQDAYEKRFKLEGYEDLELSTQILMKEAIKRGIKVDIVDRSDNFIALTKENKREYVKQATKTSKDNYVTVLMMENKVVTKKVLEKEGIVVPVGIEVQSLTSLQDQLWNYEKKPIVVKPKSTNFGLGISIFPQGASREDIAHAYTLAAQHDETVLVEEFIQGKEYRFLVIGEEVVGILHRVPANVVGDGVGTIEQLVNLKNTNPLRGKGYKTPLEKIQLDDQVIVFLRLHGKDITYIPAKGEVVYLRENSNISTGGDSIDYTDGIPQHFKQIAVQAAKAIGATICGVDMMIEGDEYAIIELNFNPAIHIHSYPYIGKERNIAKEVLSLLDLDS
ncbi:bifunctional glutamate--cysteine ligase GshA/glutathione synthetase GshB [Bacillus paramycoides]|uniref:bifunctional glutamate--cysteine ligase GshA/glutathione synthetase GshB n=1 Tax=Bacillus paramycoides TaxID=2026194 RepID=UPI003CFC33D3